VQPRYSGGRGLSPKLTNIKVYLTTTELENGYRNCWDAMERERWLMIKLLASGKTIPTTEPKFSLGHVTVGGARSRINVHELSHLGITAFLNYYAHP
jgi:hypothetical protein